MTAEDLVGELARAVLEDIRRLKTRLDAIERRLRALESSCSSATLWELLARVDELEGMIDGGNPEVIGGAFDAGLPKVRGGAP